MEKIVKIKLGEKPVSHNIHPGIFYDYEKFMNTSNCGYLYLYQLQIKIYKLGKKKLSLS